MKCWRKIIAGSLLIVLVLQSVFISVHFTTAGQRMIIHVDNAVRDVGDGAHDIREETRKKRPRPQLRQKQQNPQKQPGHPLQAKPVQPLGDAIAGGSLEGEGDRQAKHLDETIAGVEGLNMKLNLPSTTKGVPVNYQEKDFSFDGPKPENLGDQCIPPLILLHIGKTGGTTLSSTLSKLKKQEKNRGERHFFPLYMQSHYYNLNSIPRFNPSTEVVDKLAREKLLEEGPTPSMCVAFFVRDPVDRWLSGFLSRLRRGCPAHCHDEGGQRHIRELYAFWNFPTPNSLGEALFDEQTGEPNEVAIFAHEGVFHTHVHLSHYLPDLVKHIEAGRIQFVGRQESFDEDSEKLLELLEVDGARKEEGASNAHSGAVLHEAPSELDHMKGKKRSVGLPSCCKRRVARMANRASILRRCILRR